MTTKVGQALEGAVPRLGHHSDTPGTDAQILLSEALGQPRAWILAHPERKMSTAQLAQFEAFVTAVLDGAALPHVLGWWEFFGRRFLLDAQVLIPRPETELMVEEVLGRSKPASRILDLGTGSGCIAVTLALELPESRIYASDLSWGALKVARRNVIAHGVEQNVNLINSNLIDAFAGPFDLVCANLPYVATDQLRHLDVARREPTMALDGGSSGTELIFGTLEKLPGILAPGGYALFEIDPNQTAGVAAQAGSSFPRSGLRIEKDLAGLERLLIIEGD
ncbi:MAG: peptide chain release factor N(5)-glutamine methyltransferase [Anaerolineae bacterium]|nr:MAG: peptide chain release factor N(5)-glutamine methyltransferase [Anaerolineae bacterium]